MIKFEDNWFFWTVYTNSLTSHMIKLDDVNKDNYVKHWSKHGISHLKTANCIVCSENVHVTVNDVENNESKSSDEVDATRPIKSMRFYLRHISSSFAKYDYNCESNNCNDFCENMLYYFCSVCLDENIKNVYHKAIIKEFWNKDALKKFLQSISHFVKHKKLSLISIIYCYNLIHGEMESRKKIAILSKYGIGQPLYQKVNVIKNKLESFKSQSFVTKFKFGLLAGTNVGNMIAILSLSSSIVLSILCFFGFVLAMFMSHLMNNNVQIFIPDLIVQLHSFVCFIMAIWSFGYVIIFQVLLNYRKVYHGMESIKFGLVLFVLSIVNYVTFYSYNLFFSAAIIVLIYLTFQCWITPQTIFIKNLANVPVETMYDDLYGLGDSFCDTSCDTSTVPQPQNACCNKNASANQEEHKSQTLTEEDRKVIAQIAFEKEQFEEVEKQVTVYQVVNQLKIVEATQSQRYRFAKYCFVVLAVCYAVKICGMLNYSRKNGLITFGGLSFSPSVNVGCDYNHNHNYNCNDDEAGFAAESRRSRSDMHLINNDNRNGKFKTNFDCNLEFGELDPNFVSVCEWLKYEMRLDEYVDVFYFHGFDTMDIICTITESNLNAMNIYKQGHVNKFLQYRKDCCLHNSDNRKEVCNNHN